MKLLFDEHLPKSMIRRVGDLWPGSSHVLLCGLGSTDDDIIREYALAHGYVIVTKDNDFYVSSVIRGAPPKVIWLRIGNCSVTRLEALLRSHAPAIVAFNDDPVTAILELA